MRRPSRSSAPRDQHERAAQKQPDHFAGSCAEHHAHANLLRALRHRVRHHRVQADRGEQQRDRGEDREHAAKDPILPASLRQQFVHRSDVEDGDVGIEREHGLPDQRNCGRRLAADVRTITATVRPRFGPVK